MCYKKLKLTEVNIMRDDEENELNNKIFDLPQFSYTFMDNNLTFEEKNEEIIKKRNEILLSLGFLFDENGDVFSPYSQMIDGIIGFAVGDALGVPVEFSTREFMKNISFKEMIGYGRYDVPEGTWSDDTSMLLATMDSIIQMGSIDYYDIMYKFCEWVDHAKYTATDKVFDIGFTTKKAIYRFKRHDNPVECGGFDLRDNGNGSLMRILPIVYYLYSKKLTEEEEVEIINNISSLTHAHEISCLGCKIFSDYVKQLLNGLDKIAALNFIKQQKYDKFYSRYVVEEYKNILNGNISKMSNNEIESTGYVIHTLEAVLWSILNTDTYEDAVLIAINLGGDTDTIGALVGSLGGMMYGKEKIPKRWLDKLRNREYLENLTEEFVDSLRGIVWHKQK